MKEIKLEQKKGRKEKRKVIILSLLLMLVSLIVPTIAGVIIGVKEITDVSIIYFVQFLAIFVGCILTVFLIKKSQFSFKQIGFQKIIVRKWLLVILAIEVVPFVSGINTKLDGKAMLILLGFMISVGFFEEMIYRGLILNYLVKINAKVAIILSSSLFSIGHAMNLLSGADLKTTIAQIIFAFLFGLVCAEIAIVTKSIVLGIVWHASHNVIDHLTNTSGSFESELLIVVIQCVLLTVVSYILWKKAFR